MKIREEDRHLTTFYTPWGRYRYKTAPQGYNTSGDAYIHQYDMVVMYAANIKMASYQVAEYLMLVGKTSSVLLETCLFPLVT